MSSHLNYEFGSPTSDHQPIWEVEEGLSINPEYDRNLPVVADIKKNFASGCADPGSA